MLSRRDFLKLGSVTAVTATAAACSAVGRQVAQRELPESLTVPTAVSRDSAVTSPPINPIWRILNRAGYGPHPGDFERVTEMGLEAYLEEQLNPEAIDDPAANLMARNLSLYHMDIGQLAAQEEKDAGHRECISAAGRRHW